MYGDRRRLTADVEDAFNAQHRLTVAVEQHRKPDTKRGPVQGLLEGQAEGLDIVPVAIPIVRMTMHPPPGV